MSLHTPTTFDTLERWRESAAGADAVGVLDQLVEHLAAGATIAAVERPLWHELLDVTGRPDFLQALGSDEQRRRWADAAFALVRQSDFRIGDLVRRRADQLGEQPLFEELADFVDRPDGAEAATASWTYARVLRRARTLAALFLETKGAEASVALYLDNCVEGACCDLACLCHDILVAPIGPQLEVEELVRIFDRLRITIAVTDSEDRTRRLLQVRQRVRVPFEVMAVRNGSTLERGDAALLAAELARLTPERVEEILDARPQRAIDEVCTVMFTSGSTGRPKGVAFTQLHLVTKRFARAAALPDVGRDETLLCYLPLYHTFGRFLEMLGSIYWRGTYVFAGNPSAETLLEGLRHVRPTGLISIPLRWAQIRDRIVELVDRDAGAGSRERRVEHCVAAVTGGRLRWGLSAAGYLDPKVFRFFQQHGVELCSGFGMTEATGGITMSPPGDYVDDTVGVPLPGMRVRFSERDEMLIGGPYVARYLAEDADGLECEPAMVLDGEEWLRTGDIFRPLGRGHLSIVDRIKDIYKNSRGQTIAPRRVEREFAGVPGMRRVFLVGDRRAYNTLLIAPDDSDPVLVGALDATARREYFHRIVAAANQRLWPYERIVSFAILDRDFETARGELTPKGSLRRRVIEENFAGIIDGLYRSRHVELVLDGLRVRIPHWLYRDLGVLEDDIAVAAGGLVDRHRGRELAIRRGDGTVRVGDLEYEFAGDVVDLGLMTRQPRLWLGNGALIRFGSCKDGWDVALGPFSGAVRLPADRPVRTVPVDPPAVADPDLRAVNRLLQTTLSAADDEALSALTALGQKMAECEERLDGAVRHRLKALARHPCEELRCLAYRLLLQDRPMHGYDEAFGAFIRSGLPFLNEQSIHAIATSNMERRRLEALRQRLHRYRRELDWPAEPGVRRQFESILRLLVDFVSYHPEYYKPVRAELACWTLHRRDPELARFADGLLQGLFAAVRERAEARVAAGGARLRREQIAFDEEIPRSRRLQLLELLRDTAFLEQSLMLAFDERRFDPREVPADGIWVSLERAGGRYRHYRVSINTTRGRHFHLLIVLRQDTSVQAVRDVNLWMMALADHPYEPRTLPRFGCVRPELAAFSLEFLDEPDVEHKIRLFAGVHPSQEEARDPGDWRGLYVRAMTAFFRAWDYGGRRIVPGGLRPANVVVPDLDSDPSSFVLSLGGLREYARPSDLVRPLHRSFYRRVVAHHPACADIVSLDWIFEACLEAVGENDGRAFLEELEAELAAGDDIAPGFAAELAAFRARLASGYHVPLALHTAVDRYHRWRRRNRDALAAAQIDEIEYLARTYRIDRLSELARYHLYRDTYFAGAGRETRSCFDRLLAALAADPDRPATQRVELADLQASIIGAEEREVFGRMVFPVSHAPLDVLAVGDSGREQVTVRTWITDRSGERYAVREPLDAGEVGLVYRLFLRERYPMRVSELDRQLLALDSTDRLIAGIVYKHQEIDVVHIHGVVVSSVVSGLGIASALLEDFFERMQSRGVRVVKAGFVLHRFAETHGFVVDKRWGGQVRFLDAQKP